MQRIGRWILERELGAGGLGVVHEARCAESGERAAVKLLTVPAQPGALERLARVTETLRALEGERERAVLACPRDFGETAGRLWFATALLDGRSAEAEVQRSGPLAPPRARAIALVAAVALGRAHARGLVHQGVKASNLFLSSGAGRDAVTWLDCGLSAVLAPDARAAGLVSTPSARSPEQAFGGPVDARADVYSLGAVLYRLLTGRAPFGHYVSQSLIAHYGAGTPLLTGVGAPAAALIRRAMAPRPSERFQSMAELAAALAAWTP